MHWCSHDSDILPYVKSQVVLANVDWGRPEGFRKEELDKLAQSITSLINSFKSSQPSTQDSRCWGILHELNDELTL